MTIVVSRHPAAIEFIRQEAGYQIDRVVASAVAEDVAGQVVYGNLPLHLAAQAVTVFVVEFQGTAPRGTEYTLDEMVAAGARLTEYHVTRVERDDMGRCAHCGAYGPYMDVRNEDEWGSLVTQSESEPCVKCGAVTLY